MLFRSTTIGATGTNTQEHRFVPESLGNYIEIGFKFVEKYWDEVAVADIDTLQQRAWQVRWATILSKCQILVNRCLVEPKSEHDWSQFAFSQKMAISIYSAEKLKDLAMANVSELEFDEKQIESMGKRKLVEVCVAMKVKAAKAEEAELLSEWNSIVDNIVDDGLGSLGGVASAIDQAIDSVVRASAAGPAAAKFQCLNLALLPTLENPWWKVEACVHAATMAIAQKFKGETDTGLGHFHYKARTGVHSGEVKVSRLYSSFEDKVRRMLFKIVGCNPNALQMNRPIADQSCRCVCALTS